VNDDPGGVIALDLQSSQLAKKVDLGKFGPGVIFGTDSENRQRTYPRMLKPSCEESLS